MENKKTCWNCGYHAPLLRIDKSEKEGIIENRHVCLCCMDYEINSVYEIPLDRMGECCELWCDKDEY